MVWVVNRIARQEPLRIRRADIIGATVIVAQRKVLRHDPLYRISHNGNRIEIALEIQMMPVASLSSENHGPNLFHQPRQPFENGAVAPWNESVGSAVIHRD